MKKLYKYGLNIKYRDLCKARQEIEKRLPDFGRNVTLLYNPLDGGICYRYSVNSEKINPSYGYIIVKFYEAAKMQQIVDEIRKCYCQWLTDEWLENRLTSNHFLKEMQKLGYASYIENVFDEPKHLQEDK